jgi:maltoporin
MRMGNLNAVTTLRKNPLLQLALSSATVLTPLAAMAQTTSEAEEIRKELRAMEEEYQQRTDQLEERLRRLEAPGTDAPAPESAPAEKPESPPGDAPGAANAAAAREFANQQFQRSTESRERAVLAESSPLRERVEQVLQDFLEIRGYFRAGYGRNDQGGPQAAFQAPGAFAKYRLGNEAETYGELTFGKNFYVPNLFKLDPDLRPDGTPTGPIARVQVTMSVHNPYQDLLTSSGTDFGLPEAWASIGNVIEAQPAMKFWAGYRYYRRHDIHINDFFFYNMSGAGGGVEDFELPFGKLALAWIGAASQSGFSDVPNPDPANEAGFSKGNWDLRLYDVPLPLGEGEFGVVYARADSGQDANGNSAPDSSGFAFTFLHTHEKFLSDDGVNKFSLQFGTGAAKTFISGFETFTQANGVFIRPDDRDSWRFRVTEHFTANLNENFSIGPALVYQLTDYADQGDYVQWASVGVRPIVHFNDYLSLAFEGGVDWVKDDQADTRGNLYKLTLAPQVSLGGRFMSRPVIRGFVTYGHWSDDFVGQVGGNDYVDENAGVTYGVQMEAWW